MKNMYVPVDDVTDFLYLHDLDKYNLLVTRVAENAPIRICEGEKISGAATLGGAILHAVPASFNGGPYCASISHLTVDFDTVLKHGVNSLIKRAQDAYEIHKGGDRERFANSCIVCLDAFKKWHKRYLDALEGMPEYRNNYNNLLRVPFESATNFYEAVQSLWFTFAFIRLCGNWPGIGRIDYLLGPYLKKDLGEGKITLDEAREILAHFFIKGCEWVRGEAVASGDAQHYQNILLAGIDENGIDITNEVTYLVLDIIEEFGISDFPTSVRIGKNTDERLLRRVAEVMRYGGGVLAVYNEDLVIDALVDDGYALTEARKFANDGCWEVQIPGKTYFTYFPFDCLHVLQHRTLCGYENVPEYESFEQLYSKFKNDMLDRINELMLFAYNVFPKYETPPETWDWYPQPPCTVVSLFEQGCIEKGSSYLEGGPTYNLFSPHLGGLADTVNSLYTIKKLVFEEKKISFADFMDVLKRNWEGDEVLRQYISNRYVFYGNDSDEVDSIAVRVCEDFADLCASFDGSCGYHFPAGISTFGRQLEWAPTRLASPHGKKQGEILAGNASPTPQSDREGPTAIIRSYCKPNLKRMTSGTALDVKLLPSSVEGEDGIGALVGLMRGFVELGGFFMQPDVVDSSILRRAQENPEEYPTLSVRVSGWNARFVTMSKEWQDMVIAQNEH